MSQEKKRKFRFPILAKTILIIFVLSIVVVEIAMTYYSLVSSNRNNETYSKFADNLSDTISKVIDKDDVTTVKSKVKDILIKIPTDEVVTSEEEDEAKQEAYMEHYVSLEEDEVFQGAFSRLQKVLKDIEKANDDFSVTSIYLAYVHKYTDADGVEQGFFVYLVDSAEDDPCPPGWVDPLYDINRGVLDDQTIGFPSYVTDTGYGYLATSATYIEGSERTYAAVDVSMTAIRAQQAASIIRLFVYMIVTINLIAIAGVVIVYFVFNRPLSKINNVAKSFDNNDPDKSHEQFVNLNVRTRDELSELAESIKNMEAGVHERISQLTEMNKELLEAQQQSDKMSALANKDALTGVKSKIAYHTLEDEINEKIKAKEKIAFGLAMIDLNYLKNTNDEFGHVAGDAAIIRLSNIICLTFKHSPVYRVGGDEFVVILRDRDYNDAQELVAEFNERITDTMHNEKLPPFERIGAAIGYVRFDPKKDKCVDDVLNRADQLMYKRKREMKL